MVVGRWRWREPQGLRRPRTTPFVVPRSGELGLAPLAGDVSRGRTVGRVHRLGKPVTRHYRSRGTAGARGSGAGAGGCSSHIAVGARSGRARPARLCAGPADTPRNSCWSSGSRSSNDIVSIHKEPGPLPARRCRFGAYLFSFSLQAKQQFVAQSSPRRDLALGNPGNASQTPCWSGLGGRFEARTIPAVSPESGSDHSTSSAVLTARSRVTKDGQRAVVERWCQSYSGLPRT